jgi:hypothetical protein
MGMSMRFLGNMLGSFVILGLMMFLMTVVVGAPQTGGPLFDLRLSVSMRVVVAVLVLSLTLFVAFKTPPWGLSLWMVRIFMLFFFVGLPSIGWQWIESYRLQGEIYGAGITALGMWMFVLVGVMYRSRLRAALWLKPKMSEVAE